MIKYKISSVCGAGIFCEIIEIAPRVGPSMESKCKEFYKHIRISGMCGAGIFGEIVEVASRVRPCMESKM